MTVPRISIVIVSWNVESYLHRCLESIQRHATDLNPEVIVVDNASSDGTVDMVRENFPLVHVVENSANQGFAIANNQGFAIASGEYVLILNPDTELQPNALQHMLAFIHEREDIGALGPRIVNEDGSIVRPCRRGPVSLWQILKGLFLTDKFLFWLFSKLFGTRFLRWANRRYYQNGETGCLQGSCILMRKKDLDAAGWFDERVPLYLDDGDLCFRVHKSGKKVFFLADVEILHAGGRSVRKLSNKRMSSMVGSLAHDLYFSKHFGWFHVGIYHLMLLGSSLIFLIVDSLLWPLLVWWRRDFIHHYIAKHWQTLIYSLTFRYNTDVLPVNWPRRFPFGTEERLPPWRTGVEERPGPSGASR